MIEEIMNSVDPKKVQQIKEESSTKVEKVIATDVPSTLTSAPSSEIPSWAKELMEQNKKLQEEVNMFKDMAGKNAIASYLDGKKDFSKKTVHFKLWKGIPVIAWSDLDYSGFNPRAMDSLGENIQTTLTLLDGTREKVNYVLFVRANDIITVPFTSIDQRVVEVEWPADLVESCKLNSKRMTLETKFVNV